VPNILFFYQEYAFFLSSVQIIDIIMLYALLVTCCHGESKFLPGALINVGSVLRNLQQSYRSSFAGQRIRDVHSDAASLRKEIYRSDPERLIHNLRSRPLLNSNGLAGNTTTGAGIYACFSLPLHRLKL
jgi:hypothetical protein